MREYGVSCSRKCGTIFWLAAPARACREGGIISENDAKKAIFGGKPKVDMRYLFTMAAQRLKDLAGLELIRVMDAPTKDDIGDRAKNQDVDVRYTAAWMLRRSTEPVVTSGKKAAIGAPCDESLLAANRAAARSGVAGFTMAERGLLAVVLTLSMQSKTQAVREDGLWAYLAALDKQRFPLRCHDRAFLLSSFGVAVATLRTAVLLASASQPRFLAFQLSHSSQSFVYVCFSLKWLPCRRKGGDGEGR